MKKYITALIFGTILVLGACGGNDGSSEGPANNDGSSVDVAEAEAIYKDNCASCHGGDLSGGNGPELTNIGSEMSQEEIEQQIEEGGDGMPPELVTGDELTTLATWLSEQK